MLNHPLTQYMLCSPDEGRGGRGAVPRRPGAPYTVKPIYLRASAVRTRRLGAFEVHSPWLPIEETAGPTVDVSRAAYETAGIGPEDVDVIQLQDTDAGAEVIHLAENGFCADGEQEKLVADGELEIGGRLPVNTDGGLLANGEPIGASGLRQVHEIVLQLRGLRPAIGRCRARRRSATRSCTARPASPACRSSPSDGARHPGRANRASSTRRSPPRSRRRSPRGPMPRRSSSPTGG